MKWIVRALLGLAAIAVVGVAAAAVMLLTVNPNDHKDRIAAIVKEKTGRDLVIAGDMKVMFYPVLGFEVGGLTLGNPAGFVQKDFLSVGEAQAGVRLLPLLQHRIELSKIRMVEPQITVIKNKDGSTNLEFAPKKEKAAAETKGPGPDMNLTIDGVEIRNAKVTYIDRQTGKTTYIDPLNLDFPGWSAGRAVPVSLDMAMKAKDGGTTRIDADAEVKADPRSGTYNIRGAAADISSGGMNLSLNGDIDADTKAQTLAVSNLKAGWAGTNLAGKASVKGFGRPAVTFDLASPSVDVDALMAPGKAGADQKSGKAKKAGGDLIPMELARKLTMDGTIDIGTLKVSGMTFSDVDVGVRARDGVITADPVALKLYDGALKSAVRIDARGAAPAISAAGSADGIQIAKLLKEKMGQDYLSGTGKLSFDLSARGNNAAALNDTAGGMFRLQMGEGYINKWQLSRLINQAIAYFETGKLSQNASDKVYFTSLDAKFQGSNGVFRNDDLTLIAPKSHALGAGDVNLRNKAVDYTVRVGLGDNPEKFAGKRHLPIRITGPFSSLNYAIDLESLAMEAAQEKIEEKKQELLNKALGKLGGDKPAAEAAPEGQTAEGAATKEPEGTPPAQDDPARQLMEGLFGGGR